MPIQTLPNSNKINRDALHEINFNTLTAKFGETYEEIKAIGINDSFKTFQITWLNLNRSERNALKTILKLAGSWQIFNYAPCDETITYKVRVEKDSVTITPIGNNLFEISAKLKQVFNGV